MINDFLNAFNPKDSDNKTMNLHFFGYNFSKAIIITASAY